MIEDGEFPNDLVLRSPVEAIRRISADPTLRATVQTTEGRHLTALEMQERLLEHALRWASRHGLDSVGDACGALILDEWERVLADLSRDPPTTADRVDWVAKKSLIDAYATSRSTAIGDPRLKAIDIQYHDLRPGRCLADKTPLRRLIDRGDVEEAVTVAPHSTRAYFRGRVLTRWPEAVVAANWDGLVLDVGGDVLVRVPMNDPLRGTHELLSRIVDDAQTIGELVSALGVGESELTT
jgi:proteasome accessory factor A